METTASRRQRADDARVAAAEEQQQVETDGGEGERGDGEEQRQEGRGKRDRAGHEKQRRKKEEWLSHSRWRSKVITLDKTNVYFQANDGEWERWFTIEPSRLGARAGNGVYAARPFRRGETLTYYGGRDIGKAGTEAGEAAMQEAREGPAGRYILNLGGRYIEADLKSPNPAHVLNDAGYKHANAECRGGGEVRARRAIGAGEELFWCYGTSYWNYWGARVGGRLTLPDAAAGSSGRGRSGEGSGDAGRVRRAGRGGQDSGNGGEGRAHEGGQTRVLRRRVDGRTAPEGGVT